MVQSRGGVPRTGPLSVMINSPEAARRAVHVSDYLRNESTLPKHVQELAMLVTAREMDCQYVWNAHAASGKQAGLTAGLVDALRDKKPLPALKPEEAAVVKYGTAFLTTHSTDRCSHIRLRRVPCLLLRGVDAVTTLKISTLVSRHLRRLRSLAPTSNQLCGR